MLDPSSIVGTDCEIEAVIAQLTQTVARSVNAGFGVNIFRGVDLG